MESRAELLEQKLALLNALLAETLKLKDMITANDMDGLGSSLAARQQLMDTIDGLDRRIAELPPEAGRGQANEIRAVLERIMILDRENRSNASLMADTLTANSREVAVLKSVKAYAAQVDRSSKFVDREG